MDVPGRISVTTPLGFCLVIEADGMNVRSAAFTKQKVRELDARDPLLREAAAQVRAYFARKLEWFDLPLQFDGTPFENTVWRAVSQLGFGHFVSYAEVGRAIGHPRSHRGVAAAMGRTPIDLFVPAHRVIGGDGTLKGCAPRSVRARLAAFEGLKVRRSGEARP